MSSTFSRWILPVILVLVAIVGWGAYFLSSELPETGQTESAGLDQELQALQQNFAELQLDQESLLQENIALRALNESLRAEDTSGAGQASYPRLPGGRENYLEKRLQYASEQLRRHRRGMYQQPTVSTDVSEQMTDSDQQTQTETVTTQPSEAEIQQLREQLAYQAKSFEEERMNYTQTIELLSDKLGEAPVTQVNQSAVSANVSEETIDSDQQAQTDSDQQAQTDSDQQPQTDSDQQTETAIVATQPFEAENQQLRAQLADQAELFEKERMNYTQTIELLSDKLEEALVTRINQSGIAEDASSTSETDEISSATESELVASVDQSSVSGDESIANETDEPTDVSTQTISEAEQPAETTVAEVAGESGQVEGLMVATVQPSTQTESTNDVAPAQDSAASDTTERLEEQINGILEKLNTAELNQAAMVEAQEEIDQLNQHLQSERRENQQLHQALQTLNEKVVMLNSELNSANERTRNMERMTETITEENRRFGELIDDLQETLGMTIAERDSQISSIESEFRMIEYSTDILFESGSTVLSERGKQILKEFFVNLEVEEFSDRVINIEGHTDDVPIAGSLLTLYPSNWELSLARAASATRFLIEQGVDAERLRPVGRGSSQPRASNDTEAGKAANRRIEIHLAPELERTQN